MPVDFAEIQRQVRVACAPEPGDPRATLRRCEDCGRTFWEWTRKWRHRCPDCSADRARRQRADPAGWQQQRAPAGER